MKTFLTRDQKNPSSGGAIRLGLLDILTALALLGLLLWAGWKQFPAFSNRPQPAPTAKAT